MPKVMYKISPRPAAGAKIIQIETYPSGAKIEIYDVYTQELLGSAISNGFNEAVIGLTRALVSGDRLLIKISKAGWGTTLNAIGVR